MKPKVKESQQTPSLLTKKLAVSAQEALRRKRAPTRARSSSSSSTAFTSLFSRRKGLDHAHLHRINAAQAHTRAPRACVSQPSLAVTDNAAHDVRICANPHVVSVSPTACVRSCGS